MVRVLARLLARPVAPRDGQTRTRASQEEEERGRDARWEALAHSLYHRPRGVVDSDSLSSLPRLPRSSMVSPGRVATAMEGGDWEDGVSIPGFSGRFRRPLCSEVVEDGSDVDDFGRS
jgi:hypothetical protein